MGTQRGRRHRREGRGAGDLLQSSRIENHLARLFSQGDSQMRKLRIFEHISLDGVIQASADENNFPYRDWSAPYRTPAGREMLLARYGEKFDLLLCRRTYDGFSGFWPTVPNSPIADRLNAAKKYVVTHRPESLEWGPFEAVGPGVGSEIVEGIRRIKSQEGTDLLLMGS